MNKDVIYIEPEDDITDIINRLNGAKEKVVALVPPKNLGILRSAVNTKLIAKAAKRQDKVAVFVTTDKSLMKLAMSAGIPVAKTLQSRPVVPTAADLAEKPTRSTEVIDQTDEDLPESDEPLVPPKDAASAKTSAKTPSNRPKTAKNDVETINSAEIDEDLEREAKKSGKNSKGRQNKAPKDKKSKVPTIDSFRKKLIIGGAAGVALIIFLIWAIVFAPSVKIVVAMHTTANSFSENVSFTTDKSAAKTEDGVLYLEKQEEKSTSSVDFQATGKKNVGEKASGSLTITASFSAAGSAIIPAGTTFTYNGLAYTSVNDTSLSWGGKDNDECDNSARVITDGGCHKSTSVRIVASESGEKYNISAAASGWHSSNSSIYSAANSAPVDGGTDKTVTIVQQSDIDAAKEKLNTGSKLDKDALTKKFSKDYLTIESSYSEDPSDIVSTPAAGEEVADGVTPKLEMTTTASMYGVDKTEVEKYIKHQYEKNKTLSDDQKIYSYGEPFFERFSGSDGNFSAKLKAVTQIGPKVTEDEVLEKSKGKKIGEVQTLLKSINGVSSVSIERSFFWVGSVPDDPNKITIELKVEE